MLKKLMAYAPYQIVSALAVFAVLSLQARSLEVAQFGVLAIVMSSIEIARLVASQWVNNTFIRFYAQAENAERNEILGFSFNYIAVLLAPALLIFVLAKLLYEPFSVASISTVFLFFISKTFFMYFQQVSRLSEKRRAFQIATSVQAGSSVIFTWLSLIYTPTVDSALLAMACSFLLGIAPLKPRGKLNLSALRPKETKKYLSYGVPLIFTGLIIGLASRADRFIIGELMHSYAVGIYSAISALLMGIMALGFTLIASCLYPEVIKNTGSPEKLRSAHSQYLEILIATTLPLLVATCVLSTTIIELLLGRNYTIENGLIFYFLAIATYLTNLKGHYFDHGLQFTLKTALTPYISAIGLLVNIALCIILIKWLGLTGASIAALVTSLLMTALTWYLARKNNYAFEVSRETLLIIVGNVALAAFMLATSKLFTFNGKIKELLIIGIASVVFYAALIALINPQDLRRTSLGLISQALRKETGNLVK